MDILEYLKKEEIKWFPIKLKKVYDEVRERWTKTPEYTNGYMPRTDDFERMTEEELKQRQKKANESEHIAIDTREVYQIDFDTREHEEVMGAMKEKMPYFESATKKLPHCFVKGTEEQRSKRTLTKYKNVEILSGIWSFCEMKAKVYNAEVEIARLEIGRITHSVNKEVPTTRKLTGKRGVEEKTLKRVTESLKRERCEDYAEWLMVIFAIMRTGKENGYTESAQKMAHEWSKRIPEKYNEEYLDTVINRYHNKERGPGFGTLCYYIKEDNEDLFKELCKKYGMASDEYTEMKEEFERHTIKIMNPTTYLTEIEGTKETRVTKEGEIYAKYKHMTCDGNERFIKKWLEDPEIKKYSRMDFIPPPMECPEDVYNLWTGFEIEKEGETEDISEILGHIKYLCNHDEACVEYFTKWMAHIIQKPGELTKVAVVLQGEKGVGKNTLTYLLEDMIGSKYYYEVNNMEQLFGRFGTARMNRILINVDEINVPFSYKEALKNMITSRKYNHESKGLEPITMNNFNRIIFTTNNDIPIPIEVNDRRVVVFTADDSIRNNKEYFTELYKSCENPRKRRGFYEYLKGIDISEVDWVKDRPLTEEYREVQSVMIPLAAQYMYKLSNEIEGEIEMMMLEIFEGYKSFLSDHGYSTDNCKSPQLGKTIKKYEGITRGRTNKGSKYNINTKKVKKHLEDTYDITESW